MGTVTQFRKGYMYSLKPKNEHIREALERFPRKDFLPPRYAQLADRAMLDVPLKFNENYIMPQPSDVVEAFRLTHVEPGDKVLLVGAGTGFEAALLSQIVRKVYAIESSDELYEFADQKLSELHIDNVDLYHGDGSVGLAETGPYDVIIVFAASHDFPHTLMKQLRMNGRIVMPIGRHDEQRLTLGIRRQQPAQAHRSSKRVRDKKVHFLPLVGRTGYHYQTGQNPIRTMKRPHLEKKTPPLEVTLLTLS